MVILDQQMGKIEAVPPSDQFAAGALISYYATSTGNIYFLQGVNLIGYAARPC